MRKLLPDLLSNSLIGQVRIECPEERCYYTIMPELIKRIVTFEREYDEEVVFSKFLKRYGTSYSQEDFIKFLRLRYELINLYESPAYYKQRSEN